MGAAEDAGVGGLLPPLLDSGLLEDIGVGALLVLLDCGANTNLGKVLLLPGAASGGEFFDVFSGGFDSTLLFSPPIELLTPCPVASDAPLFDSTLLCSGGDVSWGTVNVVSI